MRRSETAESLGSPPGSGHQPAEAAASPRHPPSPLNWPGPSSAPTVGVSGGGEGVQLGLAWPGSEWSPVATVGGPRRDAVDVDLWLDTQHRLVLALLHLDARCPPDFRLLPPPGGRKRRDSMTPVRLERRLAVLGASLPARPLLEALAQDPECA